MLIVLCRRNQREKGCRRVTAPSPSPPVHTKAKCFCDDHPNEDEVQAGEGGRELGAGSWELGTSSWEVFIPYFPAFLHL